MAVYGTEAAAITYHADRGNTAWAVASVEDRLAARTRGTQYVDGRYREKLHTGAWRSLFPGVPTGGRVQELEWPREGAEDYHGNEIASDVVPIEVEHASYEAALRELVSPNSLSPDYVPGEQVIKEKVDVLEVTYADPSKFPNDSTLNRPIVPVIDEIIAPLILASGNRYGITGVLV